MILDFLERVYGVEAFEYDRPDAHSLLICAGTGLMLSIMDRAPRFRACVDHDVLMLGGMQHDRFARWLRCAEATCDLVAVAGWYSSTNPKPLADALAGLRRRPLVYVQFHGVGDDPFRVLRTAASLEEFFAQVDRAPKRFDNLDRRHVEAACTLAREEGGPGHSGQQPTDRSDEELRLVLLDAIDEASDADDAAAR